MPYTKTTWTSGTTPVDAPEMNNLETQYTEATLSLNPDVGIAVVLNGCTGVRDGTNLAQLDFTGGVAYVQQADGTFRERKPTSQNFTVTIASTTYFLDLNPDGTLSWGTAHSAVTGHITLLQLTTDGSTHIVTPITDTRPLTLNLYSGASSSVIPQIGGNTVPRIRSNGGGSAGMTIWVGTTDPGGNAQEGDIWINA